jgi:hypothetical protein
MYSISRFTSFLFISAQMANDLVFITGGTGHIGFRTLVIALQLGYSVRAAVIMSLWINVTVVMMVTVVSSGDALARSV